MLPISSRRSSSSIWSVDIPPSLDPAINFLRFETDAQVLARRQTLITRIDQSTLLWTEKNRLINALAKCTGQPGPCGCTFCPICARQFRRVAYAQTMHAMQAAVLGGEIVAILTVGLKEVEVGHLASFPVRTTKTALYMQLARLGFKGSLVTGGIEAGRTARRPTWRLHAHLLAIGVQKPALDHLRASLALMGRGALRVDILLNPVEQISYLYKYVTGHRPAPRTGPSRPSMVPLRGELLADLVSFHDQHSFADLRVMFGGRVKKNVIDRDLEEIGDTRAYAPTSRKVGRP